MKTCKTCGRAIKTRYSLCFHCARERQRRLLQQLEVLAEPLPEQYEESEENSCVMCGREWGTALRSDGKFYCATCWAVWNG